MSQVNQLPCGLGPLASYERTRVAERIVNSVSPFISSRSAGLPDTAKKHRVSVCSLSQRQGEGRLRERKPHSPARVHHRAVLLIQSNSFFFRLQKVHVTADDLYEANDIELRIIIRMRRIQAVRVRSLQHYTKSVRCHTASMR